MLMHIPCRLSPSNIARKLIGQGMVKTSLASLTNETFPDFKATFVPPHFNEGSRKQTSQSARAHGILMRPWTVGLGGDMNNEGGSHRPRIRLLSAKRYILNKLLVV
jgi:hypothetical protein